MENTQRQRVKDILSIDIRRLETEIINLKQLEEKSTIKSSVSNSQPPKQRCYEVKLTQYGILVVSYCILYKKKVMYIN